jgi:tetratricopeptide (TPR) repeat protein
MKASKFIDLGDDLFHQQKHHEALQRYKSATAAAPDMPETWLRQGFALAATGRYDLAAKAFLRASAIEPEVLDTRLKLDDLYRDATAAKTAHYDAVARTALAEPDRFDLLYILGMMLHFDGQPERAVSFFSAAKELQSTAASSASDESDSGPKVRPASSPTPAVEIGVET